MSPTASEIIAMPGLRTRALRRALLAVAAAAILTLPFWAPGDYFLKVAILALTFAVLSTSLNLVFGFAGLLSFAQVGFWGMGAYASALCAVDLSLSPWLSIAAGGLASATAAVVIGAPALRVSRASFVIVTLSFTLVLALVSRSWVELTRGPLGIPGLPSLDLSLPGIGTLSGQDPSVFYFFALGLAAFAVGLVWRLTACPMGRVLLAINQNEPLARSQGIDATRYQLFAFVVSGLLTGMAGGLYVFHLTIVDPTIFDTYYTEMLLIIVILGGPGNLWAVLAASLLFTAIPELLRVGSEYRLVLFGAILVASALAFPRGLGGWLEQRRFDRWRRESRR